MKTRMTAIVCALLVTAGVARAQGPADADPPLSSTTTEDILADRNRQDAMEEQLASWLALANHSKVQLAKIAVEKSNREDVRQLAQQMIDDHQALQTDLKPYLPEAVEVEKRNQTDTDAERRAVAAQHHGTLLEVIRLASKYELKLTTELFGRYEDQDFDMAYLGQQTVTHVQMLATLHAMKYYGSEEFQQFIAGAIETTTQHFQDVTLLAQRLEDDRRKQPGDATAAAGEEAEAPSVDVTVGGETAAARDEASPPTGDATADSGETAAVEDEANAPSGDTTAPGDDTAAPSDDAADAAPGDEATPPVDDGLGDLGDLQTPPSDDQTNE